MIEKDIEKTLQSKCLAALTTDGVTIHPISPLSSIAGEQIEKSTADGFLVVSVQPREYDTPMVPTCKISATVSLLVRAEMTEVDFGALVEKLISLFDTWQACLDDVHGPFSSEAFWARAKSGLTMPRGRTPTATPLISSVWCSGKTT